MPNNGDDLERTIAFITADFEDRGYHVLVDPSDEEIPPELARQSVDMIAVREDDRVIVEIKHRGGTRRSERDFRQFARIAELAGWRVQFVLAAPYASLGPTTPRDTRPIREQAAASLQDAVTVEDGLARAVDARERIDTVLRLILGEPPRSDAQTADLLVSAWSLGYVVEDYEYKTLRAVVTGAEDGVEVDRSLVTQAMNYLTLTHQRWIDFPAERN